MKENVLKHHSISYRKVQGSRYKVYGALDRVPWTMCRVPCTVLVSCPGRNQQYLPVILDDRFLPFVIIPRLHREYRVSVF